MERPRAVEWGQLPGNGGSSARIRYSCTRSKGDNVEGGEPVEVFLRGLPSGPVGT